MDKNEEQLSATWTGPFSWPAFEAMNGLPSIPKHPGIYLLTAEYKDGYLIYCAGITRRIIPARFREHTRKYRSGDYTVLDIDSMRAGIRDEIWHGWGWTPEKRSEFARRKEQILRSVDSQLAGFRIFVANITVDPRILERLEASIMQLLYLQELPLSHIPDRGMRLAPRRQSESTILVKNISPAILYGLPPEHDI